MMAAAAGARPHEPGTRRSVPSSKGSQRMKFNRRALVACFALLCMFFFAANVEARQSRLIDPAAVAIPAGMTDEQVVKDIKRALAGRGWMISEEKPGDIVAELNLREHWAKIHVTHDGK